MVHQAAREAWEASIAPRKEWSPCTDSFSRSLLRALTTRTPTTAEAVAAAQHCTGHGINGVLQTAATVYWYNSCANNSTSRYLVHNSSDSHSYFCHYYLCWWCCGLAALQQHPPGSIFIIFNLLFSLAAKVLVTRTIYSRI